MNSALKQQAQIIPFTFAKWRQGQARQTLHDDTIRWGISFLVVLSVSGASLWYVMHLPAPVVATSTTPPAAIAIDMAPEPVSTLAPQTDIPPGPQQALSIPDPTPVEPPKVAAPPSPAPNPPLPVPKLEKPRKIIKKHKPTLIIKKITPENLPPAETATAPPASEVPPALAQVAPTSGTPSPRTSHDPITWQGALLAQLEKFKRYPAEAMSAHQEGAPTITFTMDRLGHVLSVQLAHSSGHALLDAEAVALPKRAQPLPVPPDSVKGNTITLTVPVEFYIH